MKRILYLVAIFCGLLNFGTVLADGLPQGVPSTGRKVFGLNQDWRYYRKVNIQAEGDTLKWTNTWGVPGDLSFMIETGKKEEAPILRLRVSDAIEKNRIALTDYQPTFGNKIQVSTAGGGTSGDGGSNKGAKGFAQINFQAAANEPITITIDTKLTTGTIGINGFDLMAL